MINVLIRKTQWESLIQIGEPAVEQLIDSIGQVKNSSLRFVLTTLGDIGDSRGIEMLIHYINLEPNRIRFSVMKVARKNRGSPCCSTFN